jgi:hypothetical protein
MATRRFVPWIAVAGGLLVVSALAACGGGGSTTTTPAATIPTTTKPATTSAPATSTTTAAGIVTAPKALHQAAYAVTPPACNVSGCHAIGGAGVGAKGGVGMPANHEGRTADTCKSCHQLGS